MRVRFLLRIVIIAAISVIGCRASAAPEYNAAGIVAFTRIQGQTYVLLADHVDSDRGWGSFGGGRESDEPIQVTALREFREETRCVYDSLLTVDLTGRPTVDYHDFVSYSIEVPYVPAQVFESLPARPECRGESFEERGPWAWIPLEEILRCLQAGEKTGKYELEPAYVPEGSKTKLWKNAAEILEQAVEDGLLQ